MNKQLISKLILPLALSLSFTTTWAEDFDITFLVVSDIYEMTGDSNRGGFARAAAVAKSEKFFNENVLYVHAGDTISPSLLSSIDNGAHVIDLLNTYPPDVFVPGNHEFDFGPDVFEDLILNKLDSVIVGANIRDGNGRRVDGITDAQIFDIGGVKVGVYGLLSPDTDVKSSPGPNYIFLPLIETSNKTVDALKEAGADIVVALTHTALSEDYALMKDGGMDILITGDDHDLNIQYNGDVVLVETREEGDYLVAIDLKVSITERDGRKRVRWWPNFRILDSANFDPDGETARKEEVYLARLDEEFGRSIGTTNTALDTRRASVRTQETAFGNLITDAMREYVDADVGLTNGGGIRANKEYPAFTQLTRKDIFSELPFGNKVIKLEVSGADLLAAFENGVSRIEDVAGRFPHVSNVSFSFDANKPAGERVANVMVGGVALDSAATYTVATNDYMAGGGDGYGMFADATVLLSATDTDLMASVVVDYILERGAVSPRVEGRITQ